MSSHVNAVGCITKQAVEQMKYYPLCLVYTDILRKSGPDHKEAIGFYLKQSQNCQKALDILKDLWYAHKIL